MFVGTGGRDPCDLSALFEPHVEVGDRIPQRLACRTRAIAESRDAFSLVKNMCLRARRTPSAQSGPGS